MVVPRNGHIYLDNHRFAKNHIRNERIKTREYLLPGLVPSKSSLHMVVSLLQEIRVCLVINNIPCIRDIVVTFHASQDDTQ